MKSRDIIFLCQFFYPEFISSATLPFDTAEALVSAGFSVDVMCGYPKEYNRLDEKIPLKETVNGINIFRLKYLQLSRKTFIGRIINYFSFTLSIMLNFIRLKNYKTVIVYSNPPVLPLITVLSKKIFGTKIIFVSYDVYPEIAINTAAIQEKSLISKIMSKINQSLFKNVDKVVALSNEMKNYLLQNRDGLNENQIDVIPNWYSDEVNDTEKNVVDNPLFHGLNVKERTVISYFGNMGIAQDMETIAQLMKKHKNNEKYLFLFAGHGSKMDELKALVENENINNVSIQDFLQGKDFQDALSISDFFIVSLEKGLNGLCVPSKTYSYLSAGKPVIAIMDSNSDIAKDLKQYKAGICVDNNEADKLSEMIDTILHSNVYPEMAGNAQKLFKDKYTKKICTDKYINLFNEVLEEEKVCLKTEHY